MRVEEPAASTTPATPNVLLELPGRSGFAPGFRESLAPDWIRPLAAKETLRLRSTGTD
jgi:hypothetical protein